MLHAYKSEPQCNTKSPPHRAFVCSAVLPFVTCPFSHHYICTRLLSDHMQLHNTSPPFHTRSCLYTFVHVNSQSQDCSPFLFSKQPYIFTVQYKHYFLCPSFLTFLQGRISCFLFLRRIILIMTLWTNLVIYVSVSPTKCQPTFKQLPQHQR